MIQKIHIKNFKSIVDSETKLPQYIGAMVGLNGAGKTNVIQAINFVKNLIIGESTSKALKKIALTPEELLNYNQNSNEIFFSLTVSTMEEIQYQIDITLSISSDHEQLQNFIIKHETLHRIFENGRNELIYKRENSNLVDINNNPIPLAVENDKIASSIYQNNHVLNFKNIFLNIVIPDQDSLEFRESIVKSDDKGLASLIVRLRQKDPNSYALFQKVIKKLLPNFSSIIEIPTSNNTDIRPDTEKSYMVLLQEENLKGKLSMKSLSAGDLRTLYLIASVMNLNQGATFIYEETENGLHPKRLTDILAHLDTISIKKDIQIIYSTHSPIVINRMQPENIIYVQKDSQNGTKFLLLSETNHIENIKKLLNQGLQVTDYINTRIQ